jgi:YesN/AraC family two-component response regulator
MKKTILVVDDTENIHESIKAILEDEYSIISAVNVKQAKRLLKNNKVDLIILDILMPEIDGLEFLPEIKKQYPDIPVLIITAYGNENTIEKMLNIGYHNYCSKPFDLDEFRDKVDIILKINKKKPTFEKHRDIRTEFIKSIKDATKFIQLKYSVGIGVQDVAKSVGISTKHLNILFKELLGYTVKEYLVNYRLNKAKTLLKEKNIRTNSLYKIIGFKSRRTFYRYFCSFYRIPPTKYGKKYHPPKNMKQRTNTVGTWKGA